MSERHTTPIINKLIGELRELKSRQEIEELGIGHVIETKLSLLEERIHEMRIYYELQLYDMIEKCNLAIIDRNSLKK